LMESGKNSQNNDVANVQLAAQQRAPRKCSMCGSLQHNARTCPECQNII
jgi:hypothetical protein